ncbi:Ribokinase [Petrocella atlantisensis]|uniref:Ribokinase n=1 Tax=Petrocella atlantisensis TaxID=2173034 RepID=A0A3P7NX43_9FIRM|nr:ribokinase [Petrocella atlantisensis]VDN47794.1 Ribokinase [Petrocella atlantisensis]
MKEGYITVIGSLNYDMLINQERLPYKGETYTAESITYEGGGKGSNQAVQCAKLGVPTIILGKVGNDNFGEILVKNLSRYGVATQYIEKSSCATGVGIVHVLNDGSVYATIVAGANYDFGQDDLIKIKEVIDKSQMLILQMEIPIPIIEATIKMAHEKGVYIILNAAPAKTISVDVLGLVDCLVVNESEATFYAGERIDDVTTAINHYKRLKDLVKGIVIITLGENGSILCSDDGYQVIPVTSVSNVIETTGAGDSYIGTFAYAKYQGYTDEQACILASKAAAITITKVGAQCAMPYLDDLESK